MKYLQWIDDFCYKRVQTPGMSPPRAGAWAYCLFTHLQWNIDLLYELVFSIKITNLTEYILKLSFIIM